MRALDVAGPPVAGYLAMGALGATLALAGTAAALALFLDERARRAATRHATLWVDSSAAAPRGFLSRDAEGALTVRSLDAFAREVREAGAAGGLLRVRAPPRDPLWTVPADVYDWLAAQPHAERRVHVAILEHDATHFLPPVWPEETGQ